MTTPSAKRTLEGFVFNLAFLAALSSADLRVDCPAPKRKCAEKRRKVMIKINGPNGQWKVMMMPFTAPQGDENQKQRRRRRTSNYVV